MNVYYLEHNGYYNGGYIVVVEENIKKAQALIEIQLTQLGIDSNDYDLNSIKIVDNSKAGVIFVESGDY